MILDQIASLLERCSLPKFPDIDWGVVTGGEGQYTYPAELRPSLHNILNYVDSAIGADTEWLSSLECSCLWHIGKTCGMRRAVGARVRMLEEAVALNLVKRKFA